MSAPEWMTRHPLPNERRQPLTPSWVNYPKCPHGGGRIEVRAEDGSVHLVYCGECGMVVDDDDR